MELYNRKTLVFDLTERYRWIVNEVVFKLFSGRRIKSHYFDILKEGGYYLNQEGKKVVIEEINKMMSKRVRYKGKVRAMKTILQYDCHEIAKRILEEVP